MVYYLNHYDCPCGEHWENVDECTCDDRCPKCSTSCSPTESQDCDKAGRTKKKRK